jgi:MFS family permease
VGLALLADTFPANELGWAMGLVFGFNTLGYFVGPLMGGVLTRYFSLDSPFYICSMFAAVDFAGRLFVNPKPHPGIAAGDGGTGSQEHRNDPSLLRLFLCPDVVAVGVLMALSAASFAAIETLLALHMERRYNMDSLQIALVMLAFILPSIIFSIVAGFWADIFDHWMLMLVGLVIHSPASIVLAVTKSLPVFLCVAAYYSATSAIMTAASMPEMGSIVDRLGSTSYAKIYAITNIFYAAGMLAGPIFAYFFSGENSFRNCLLSVGAMMLAFIPFFLTVVTKKHSLADQQGPGRTTNHIRRDLRSQRSLKKEHA